MEKPIITSIVSSEDFLNWYWLKEEMVLMCQHLNLPYSGRKFELRDRIAYALEHEGKLLPAAPSPKKHSSFNWAKEELSPQTIITDNVSFGPNFRRFMKAQIGSKFSCHSDFMDWVKANPGKTLQDAVIKWVELEERKKDPSFKREIAANNMLAQYVRDFMAHHPESTLKEVLSIWKKKKKLPAANGFIRFAPEDRQVLG
ncbi:MAG: DUF6434 domain-containing protein [Bacteroidota bacterium]